MVTTLTRRTLLALAATTVLAAGSVTTGALLTNAATSTQHVDTTFRTVATLTTAANETGATGGVGSLVSPDGTYVAYVGTGASGYVGVYKTADIQANGSAATVYRAVTGMTGAVGGQVNACFSADSTKLIVSTTTSPSTIEVLTLATGSKVGPTALTVRLGGCYADNSYVYAAQINGGKIVRVALSNATLDSTWSITTSNGEAPFALDATAGYLFSDQETTTTGPSTLCRGSISAKTETCISNNHGQHALVLDATSQLIYTVSIDTNYVAVYNYSLSLLGTIPMSVTGGYRLAESGDHTTLLVSSTSNSPVINLGSNPPSTAKQTVTLASNGAVSASKTQPTVYYQANTVNSVGVLTETEW